MNALQISVLIILALTGTLPAQDDGPALTESEQKSQPMRSDSELAAAADAQAAAQWLIEPITIGDSSSISKAESHQPITVRLNVKPNSIQPAAFGRLLIIRQLDKLAVFDLNVAKIIAYIPLPHMDVQFAAGADGIVIHDPIAKTLDHWRIRDLTRTRQVAFDAGGRLHMMQIGSHSRGPLVMRTPDPKPSGSEPFVLRDSETLERMAIPFVDSFRSILDHFTQFDLSANGAVLVSRFRAGAVGRDGIAYTGVTAILLDNGYVVVPFRGRIKPQRHLFPDGKWIFDDTGKAFDWFGKARSLPSTTNIPIPAIDGRYYVRLFVVPKARLARGAKSAKPELRIDLHIIGLNRSLARLAGIPALSGPLVFSLDDTQHEKVWITPKSNRLVQYDPQSHDLTVHYWDIESSLRDLDNAELIFDSIPQIWLRKGTTWTHQLTVIPRGEKVAFRILAAPPGMRLADHGLLSWEVPERLTSNRYRVVVAATDPSGKETEHTIDLFTLPR